MNDNKPHNPTVDFGFHAQIPRLVRTGFRDLTPVQKWLYTCLKDLCGDHGTCYRTIKVLSEETGISTGMLSESIPILHSHGLIHGEKKKRHTGGKEVWHITIVDIWQANAKAHPTKRSHSEQTLPANVHTVNENVHSVNDLPLKRSAGEYKRSLCETEGLPVSNNSNEALPVEERVGDFQSPHALGFTEDDYHFYGTKRQHLIWNCRNWCAGQHGTCEDYVAAIENGWQEADTGKQAAVKIGASNGTRPPADHHAMLSDQRGHQDTSHPAQAVTNASTPGRAASPPAAAVPHSLQGPQDGATTVAESSESRASGVTQESILNDWDAVQGQPQSRDARLIKAARDGVRASPTREELAGCRDWLPTTDRPGKPWYRLHGVALWDVIEKLGAYRSYLALSIEPAPLADMPKPKPIDVYTAYSLDTERSDRNLEKLRAKRLAREASQQGGAGI